ncbi:hypothetical protein [Rhizobium sp. TH135]|uniref:hypothetical protein n=1 Tax=Rhizobium sp. TH135 TaxID=2067451 RepID=UPI0011809FE3|nr:hypothetical protein [Rhizobium sp. TH135]
MIAPVGHQRATRFNFQASHPAGISHQDKLRSSDSELERSDSALWKHVSANAVFAVEVISTCHGLPATCLKLRIPDSELRISDSSTGIFDSEASEVAALMPVWHAGHLLE